MRPRKSFGIFLLEEHGDRVVLRLPLVGRRGMKMRESFPSNVFHLDAYSSKATSTWTVPSQGG